MTELELSVVVAEKVREFVNIELQGNWETRYSSVLTAWVENELAELLRYILGRGPGESVGEEALKAIALRALTDLRFGFIGPRLIAELLNYLILLRNSRSQRRL